MKGKYIIIDPKNRTWRLTGRIADHNLRGRFILPAEAFKELTGISDLTQLRWPESAEPEERNLSGILTVTDTEAMTNIWRTGGYLRTKTFALAYLNRKHAEKRVRILRDNGYLNVMVDPTPKSGKGASGNIVYLTLKGAEAVSARVGVSIEKMRLALDAPKTNALVHQLDTADFLLTLSYAMKATGTYECRYTTDIPAEKGDAGLRGGEAGEMIPDAVLEISHGNQNITFLLEYDEGTEAQESVNPIYFYKTIRGKFEFYARMLSDEKYLPPFLANAKDGFTLLVVTTGQKRLDNMIKLASETGLSENILLALKADVGFSTVLGPVWTNPSRPGKKEGLIDSKTFQAIRQKLKKHDSSD